ncbi:hypothetical protein DFP72DRAFT_846701 [Ephemerocybe angulata]|uniref:UBL3-like ubiquitin domain-containing protein n=1 Tax=Ephemerocybe angulata TaxID=980116 RepID=A0A8H6HZZ9_9AGAR|nr:hypothetical protein DFP72DRAFT_846701 [Tulosesus angulatus]
MATEGTTPQIPPPDDMEANTVTSKPELLEPAPKLDEGTATTKPEEAKEDGTAAAATLPSNEKSAPESTSTPQPPLRLEVPVPQTHQTYITFLFLSGRRRVMNFDPDTTIGRVKELVWTAWSTPAATSPTDGTPSAAQEVEEKPPAPSYLRVLYLGRMLQDDDTLRGLKLPTHLPTSPASPTSPGGSAQPVSTIMHLSIRPFPPPGDADSGKKGRGFGRVGTGTGTADAGDNANTGCCGCVIC